MILKQRTRYGTLLDFVKIIGRFAKVRAVIQLHETDIRRPQMKESDKIFNLDINIEGPFQRKMFGLVKGTLERLFLMPQLNDLYRNAKENQQDELFTDALLDHLNLKYQIAEEDIKRIPTEGRIIVVANHPFGGIEGIILGSILKSVRPDVKIMANYLLERIPEMRDLFFFVDPFNSKESKRANLNSMRKSIEWVNDDKMLGMFPAGEVAHLKLKNRTVSDPEWNTTVGRIVRKTESPVQPIYFDGFNGAMFQIMGLIHPRLRTALLPKELLNKRDKTIDIRIGKPIPYSRLKDCKDDRQLTDYLRQRTYVLANRTEDEEISEKTSFSVNIEKEDMKPVVDPIPVEKVDEEINELPENQLLVENNEYQVFYGSPDQIPNVLHEIGRLREVTFRETSEGTGDEIDLDEYDRRYVHLFLWNNEKKELVGAYRLGHTDYIIENYGQQGLYTTTLFDIKPSLFEQISPALEMGRSFIRSEYQRSFSPLLLIWKGIGEYVVKHPQYKILFGPVSVSKEYRSFSRHLMVAFLKIHNYLPGMAKMVKPKTPFRAKRIKGIDPKNQSVINGIDDVSDIISEFESDEKGVPILLKQYLKLGGKILGFNIDPDFGDVLDGLILVDLTQTDPKILKRYMGNEGLKSFLEYHEIKDEEPVE